MKRPKPCKPPKAPPQFVGEGLLIQPGLSLIGAKTKLYEAGFEYLAGGACAAVFVKEGRVVKLVCNDEGHRAAVELFREHPAIAAFPRVYGFVDLRVGCFAYETELLEEDEDRYFDLEAECEGWRGMFTQTTVDKVLETAGWLFYSDVHENNVLFRENGYPVLADPIHAGSSSRENRTALFSGHQRGYDLGGGDESNAIWHNILWRVKPVREPTLAA